jgi:hypothetical protein
VRDRERDRDKDVPLILKNKKGRRREGVKR